MQTFRPLTFFLAANLDNIQPIIDKIRLLNGPDEKVAPITVKLFKDNPGLNLNDLKTFGEWLLLQQKVGVKDLFSHLSRIRRQRMTRWHVFVSPEDVVAPEMSMHFPMHSFFDLNCCVPFFTNCNS